MSVAQGHSSPFPYVLGRGVVESIERLSPGFSRVTLSGPELRELGTPGHTFDQRIKLIFPGAGGAVPDLAAHGEQWYQHWLSLPQSERGAMRTYSIRELHVDPDRTRLVVDFVLHLVPGSTGPASEWASRARPGDEIGVFGPRRGIPPGSGIEYAPGDARTVLLAGDETAAPAIARILEDIRGAAAAGAGRPVSGDPVAGVSASGDPASGDPVPGDLAPDDSAPGDLPPAGRVTGVAFIEVPEDSDRLEIDAPEGFEVRWLPRNGRPHGELLIPSVLRRIGALADAEFESPGGHRIGIDAASAGAASADVASADAASASAGAVSVSTSAAASASADASADDADGGEEPVWETPRFSRLGEQLAVGENHAESYFWIAGESGLVTALRRHLVRDLGIDRAQVAFMGYWRRGIAMRG